ncbi:MAG: nucleotide pyrophosphohydrolase [Candidatus Lokiarchaeota archaeon]|nr:nucleotide pyrophosphohydrolase [Candidatus Lokiarchaeota archaeon]
MNDFSTPLSELKKEMETFVKERNWFDYHHPKELAIALSIESNELLELFLFKNRKVEDIKQNTELMHSISEELADIFAYLLSMINTLKLDLTTIFLKKMDKNRSKYPTTEFNGNYTKK